MEFSVNRTVDSPGLDARIDGSKVYRRSHDDELLSWKAGLD